MKPRVKDNKILRKRSLGIMMLCISHLTSCVSSEPKLTAAQKEYIHVISKACSCQVNVEHDYGAMELNQKNQALNIVLKDSTMKIHKMDSAYLRKRGFIIADDFYDIMTHKEKYSRINVHFQSYKKIKAADGSEIGRLAGYQKFSFSFEELN